MNKAMEAKKVADDFNQPLAKESRIKSAVDHIVDILIEDSLVAAKRGQYDMSYKMNDIEKERLRLANLSEEDVVKGVIAKMKDLGYDANYNRPYINVSWR